jgi:hypothetical protein
VRRRIGFALLGLADALEAGSGHVGALGARILRSGMREAGPAPILPITPPITTDKIAGVYPTWRSTRGRRP